jgi:hypothetical protein
MNKWNRLLASLDRVFGMNNKERSTFKKLSQEFDERTNEHVIVIEYRVRVKGTVKSTPRKQPGSQQMAFLRQLAAQANTK